MKGEAYASDASLDLELDYELVCKIMDDLEKEGQMEAALCWGLRSATPYTITEF
ncbi:MAG: hypothetical protein NTY37_09710 [Methanothrix sp.]|nr:hypothetical protein [Methanothrix sp.]